MTTDPFVHLHVHDEYSLLDGAVSTSQLVSTAVRLGQPAVAQTNHGNLFGTYTFHKECLAQGIKPIIGMEAYVAPGSRFERSRVHWGSPDDSRADLSGGGAYSHLTLLATGSRGLRNLYKLSSLANTEGFYFKPRIDLELLGGLQEGIIVLSGCLSGELLTRLALGQQDEAEAYVARMKEMFGENFYIELMDHDFEYESQFMGPLLDLASRYNVRTVATNDSHYGSSSDHGLHDAMLCMGTQAKLSDEKRMRFDGHGYYIKTHKEMEALSLPQESLRNTLYVAEQIGSYDEVFERHIRMPSSGYEDPESQLRATIVLRMSERALSPDGPYGDRVENELAVIIPAGYADYFLVMEDLVQFAKSQGIWVGPGRGSGGGSLVSFLLGCTGLDPIEHGLLFERFLNPARISLPDLDVDFQASRRDEVIEYAVQKYGVDRVSRIITIGRIGAKNGLRDAARVMGRSHDVGTRLTWALPRPRAGRMPTLSECDMSKVEDLEVFALASRLEGLAKTSGVHASGLVISPVPLSDILPTFLPPKKEGSIPATQYDWHAVEELGLVKLDPLGLQMGDVITSALRMGGGSLPETLDDPATYALLRSGETRAVFQLDSPGMRSLLRRLEPREFGDIAATIALYRPGPMGVDAHLDYADRRNGRQMVQYPHPEFAGALAEILGPTYGVIVYQEQVMHTLQRICGYSLAEADLVRKAMGKKDRDLLASEFERFHQRGIANGWSEEGLQALWETLVPFADYGFNKAHAYGYGMLAYWTAYLKAHYPEAYMAAVLTYESGTKKQDEDESKQEEFISEVVRLGISVLPPSVNGGPTWTPDGNGGIYYGLTSIKGVGKAAALPIVKHGPYSTWTDYLNRVPKAGLNVGTVRALAQAGAFDVLGNREAILECAGDHVADALNQRELIKNGEVGFSKRAYVLPIRNPDYPARQAQERALLGTELSAQALVLKVPTWGSPQSWEYLWRILAARPGASVLKIRCGAWELRFPSRVHRDAVLEGITGSGIVEECE